MRKDSKKGKYRTTEGSATWEYIATISCSTMIFCVGCVPGWNSPTLAVLMAPDSPVELTASDASTLAAMVPLGHMVAPIFAMVLADKLGRKKSLMVTGIPMIIGWGLIIFTTNVTLLFIARFIGGLAVGLGMCIPPMYLGEIASAKLRGGLAMACATMINAGILFMFVIVPYLSIVMTACVSLTIVAISTISIWFIPESPYFLVMIDKIDEAEGVLEQLRGKTDVTEELDLVKQTISKKDDVPNETDQLEDAIVSKKFNAYKELFKVSGNRKALYINSLLIAACQFGGFVSIMVYAQLIVEAIKIKVSSSMCTMIIASAQLVFNVMTAFIIDKLGRKPLICISGVIAGACTLVVGVYFYFLEYTETDVTQYGIIAICGLFAYIVAVSIGLVPLRLVIMSETLATEVKGLAMSVLGVVGGVMAVIGVKAYLMIAVTWGLGHSVPFLGFAIITWTCTALILKLLPETKGRTFYEIQKSLNE